MVRRYLTLQGRVTGLAATGVGIDGGTRLGPPFVGLVAGHVAHRRAHGPQPRRPIGSRQIR